MRNSNKINLKVIVVILVLLSAFFNYFNMTGSSNLYIVQPTIYFLGAIYIFLICDKNIYTNKKYAKDITFVIIVTAIVYNLIYFFSGFYLSFGNNVLSSEFYALILNIWSFTLVLMFKEYMRFYLIHSFKNINIWKASIFIALLFILPDLYSILDVSNISEFLVFCIEDFLPLFAISFFLTYISYYSFSWTTALYVAIKSIFVIVMPILPNIDLMLLSIIDMLLPLMAFIYINNNILKINKESKREKKKTIKFYLIYFIVLIVLVLTGLNVFPIYPVVIATNSMVSVINKGDIVVMRKTTCEDIEVDDIIEYTLDDYGIVHRVVSIKSNGDFITKGDANDTVDIYAVTCDQVVGEYLFKIPYLGMPSLIFYDLFGLSVLEEVTVELGDN